MQEDKTKVEVEEGNVTLVGEVEWEYEQISLKSAIQNLMGVRNIINLITVKPKITASDVKQKINAAFLRSATVDAEKITVDVEGSKVTLSGTVRSFVEREEAANATWSALGIWSVENKPEISVPGFEFAD